MIAPALQQFKEIDFNSLLCIFFKKDGALTFLYVSQGQRECVHVYHWFPTFSGQLGLQAREKDERRWEKLMEHHFLCS